MQKFCERIEAEASKLSNVKIIVRDAGMSVCYDSFLCACVLMFLASLG